MRTHLEGIIKLLNQRKNKIKKIKSVFDLLSESEMAFLLILGFGHYYSSVSGAGTDAKISGDHPRAHWWSL